MSQPHEEPVTLVRCLTEAEATLIAEELRREGIESTLSGQITGSMRFEAPGTVDVLVHADDAAAAQTVLTRIREEAQHIDWSNVDIGEEDEGGDS